MTREQLARLSPAPDPRGPPATRTPARAAGTPGVAHTGGDARAASDSGSNSGSGSGDSVGAAVGRAAVRRSNPTSRAGSELGLGGGLAGWGRRAEAASSRDLSRRRGLASSRGGTFALADGGAEDPRVWREVEAVRVAGDAQQRWAAEKLAAVEAAQAGIQREAEARAAERRSERDEMAAGLAEIRSLRLESTAGLLGKVTPPLPSSLHTRARASAHRYGSSRCPGAQALKSRSGPRSPRRGRNTGRWG
jgi:hypothetical protein